MTKISIRIITCFILAIFANNLVADEIDQNVLDKIISIADKIHQLDSYKYKISTVALKEKKTRKSTLLYNFKKPRCIRIEWLSPRKLRGQLAVYSNGIMKVAPAWLPFVIEIDPDSALASADTNFPIYESTIGDFMDMIVKGIPLSNSAKIIDETDNDIIYELINDTNTARIKINKKTDIPIFIEQFDSEGNLINAGYIEDMETNVSFPSDFFDL